MPQAALAAVVVAYSIDLIQPDEFAAIRRVRRIEFRWAVIAFVGVVLLGTLQGILVAVIASLLGARATGLQSAGLRRRPQARHRRVPSALERASRRRVVAGPADCARRGARVLPQRAADRRQDAGRSSRRRSRRSWCSTAAR